MSWLSCMDPNQLLINVNLIALAISENLNADELNVLGNAITAIAALILAKAAQVQSLESAEDNEQKQASKKQIDDMQVQLNEILLNLQQQSV